VARPTVPDAILTARPNCLFQPQHMHPAPHYIITPSNPAAHLFSVRCSVTHPAAEGQKFALPAWIPGSYMVREFARNIVTIKAHCKGKPVALSKLDKHTWQAAPCKGPLTLEYEVYAWDLSVRSAHLDQTHGFFNGSSVFLQVLGQENQPHHITLQRPAHAADWRVATALRTAPGTKRYAFGDYLTNSYDELIDHPVEMGRFTLAHFSAHGVPHDVVITGMHDCDTARLCVDLKRICETQIAFFEPRSKKAPMDRYVFLVTAIGDGYGGLEHRASTALLCSRNDLPYASMGGTPSAYRNFLGLCSHEYFHSWNVKRIKPARFLPYDLTRENYTRLLWLFEGFTAYYDDLFLLRSGCITPQAYLDLLSKTINGVLRGSGRKKQSVADSSFDAWIKFYRADENAPNALVSYYTKGALIALALDLTLRIETHGKHSLDTVMRALWNRHGKKNIGLEEDGFAALVRDVTGVSIQRFLNAYVEGTQDPPLEQLLTQAGIHWQAKKPDALSLGAKTSVEHGLVKLTQVLDDGAAQRAGLSAGDVLVALDDLKATPDALAQLLARKRVGDKVEVLAYRRDELQRFVLTLRRDSEPNIKLEFDQKRHLT